MTIPIPQPDFGVEIEAEEKKIPAYPRDTIFQSKRILENSSVVKWIRYINFQNGFWKTRPSEGFENCCGCKRPCDCKPECHCEGFDIDPNPVTLVASVAPPVLMMPSEGSKKSIETEGGHPSKTHNDCGRMPTMPMWSYHGFCC